MKLSTVIDPRQPVYFQGKLFGARNINVNGGVLKIEACKQVCVVCENCKGSKFSSSTISKLGIPTDNMCCDCNGIGLKALPAFPQYAECAKSLEIIEKGYTENSPDKEKMDCLHAKAVIEKIEREKPWEANREVDYGEVFLIIKQAKLNRESPEKALLNNELLLVL